MPYRLTLFMLVFFTQLLVSCGGSAVRPDNNSSAMVASSHSIYVKGGVLKILSSDMGKILYVYTRPQNLNRWVTSGGGGGSQDKPWLFSSTASWALGDENGEHSSDAPRKSFNFIFNSRDMTLKVDSRTYAVRKGDLVVITLDDAWRAGAVKSGIESLRNFRMPEDDRKHLLDEIRKYYSGSVNQAF